MTERPFSNREVDGKFAASLQKIDGLSAELTRHRQDLSAILTESQVDTKASLDRILEQTTKTNGRVSRLESNAAELDKHTAVFQARIYTAVTILGFFITAIVVPVTVAYFQARIGKG